MLWYIELDVNLPEVWSSIDQDSSEDGSPIPKIQMILSEQISTVARAVHMEEA